MLTEHPFWNDEKNAVGLAPVSLVKLSHQPVNEFDAVQ